MPRQPSPTAPPSFFTLFFLHFSSRYKVRVKYCQSPTGAPPVTRAGRPVPSGIEPLPPRPRRTRRSAATAATSRQGTHSPITRQAFTSADRPVIRVRDTPRIRPAAEYPKSQEAKKAPPRQAARHIPATALSLSTGRTENAEDKSTAACRGAAVRRTHTRGMTLFERALRYGGHEPLMTPGQPTPGSSSRAPNRTRVSPRSGSELRRPDENPQWTGPPRRRRRRATASTGRPGAPAGAWTARTPGEPSFAGGSHVAQVAVEVGFEPTDRLPHHTLSRRAPSATRRLHRRAAYRISAIARASVGRRRTR